MTNTRPPNATTPSPCRGVGRSSSRCQVRRRGAIRVHLADRPARLLTAHRDDAPGDAGRRRPAAWVGHRREPTPEPGAGPPRLEVSQVRVEPRRAARHRIHLSRECRDAEVLARRRPRHDRPAARSEIEGKRVPGEPGAAHADDAARDDDPVPDDRRAGRRAREREPRQRTPGAVLEHVRGAERIARVAVAAEDVEAPGPRDGHRVVRRRRKVGEPAPAVECGRVGVRARGMAPVGVEPADDGDLVPHDGGRDLGTRNRQARTLLPFGRRRGPGSRDCEDYENQDERERRHPRHAKTVPRPATPDRRRA